MPVPVPYPGRFGPYAGLDYIERNAPGELYRTGAFNLRQMFAASLANGSVEAGGMVEAFTLALEQLVRGSRSQLANLHHQLGAFMQAEVLAAYREAHATRGRNLAPYRESTRDAGGRLERALASPELFRGTYDGIGFANIAFLDGAARQWYRLNFGAAPSAGERPRSFAVRWQGLVVGAVGYTAAPSKPFLLPRGFFREGAFYPTGPVPLHPTRGVRAWNFLDAGPEALAAEAGPAYEALYRRWFDSARRGVGPLSRVVTVAGPPPPPPPAVP